MHKYFIAEARSDSDLVVIVSHLLKKGWELQGGVSIAVVPSTKHVKYYAQAMIKEEKDEETDNAPKPEETANQTPQS